MQASHDKGITEFIAHLSLRGPFYLIANGNGLPDQDGLRRSVRRHTVRVNETLDHITLGRPATCLQLRDQLVNADLQPYPIFILNFLHHFYDPDVDLSLRQRVLGECCRLIKHLSSSKSVVVLIQSLPTEEYRQFYPSLASIADEIVEAVADSPVETLQLSLL